MNKINYLAHLNTSAQSQRFYLVGVVITENAQAKPRKSVLDVALHRSGNTFKSAFPIRKLLFLLRKESLFPSIGNPYIYIGGFPNGSEKGQPRTSNRVGNSYFYPCSFKAAKVCT